MKISTKGRYALRLMLDLAVNDNGTYIPLKAVAERQDISDKYLEQIIHQLSKANLVLSARGAQGGYGLAKKPNEYTVGDIMAMILQYYAQDVDNPTTRNWIVWLSQDFIKKCKMLLIMLLIILH